MENGTQDKEEKKVEDPGIDPGTSRMLSERSTIWANPPGCARCLNDNTNIIEQMNTRTFEY